MSDLGFEELAPGRYDGVVDKIRYSFGSATRIVITYRIETPNGVRRLEERILIGAPQSSVNYFRTTFGLTRVADILRIRGMSLAEAQLAGGLKALPELLEGIAISVLTGNQLTAGFECPFVVCVDKP
jgi:hypothetical protein